MHVLHQSLTNDPGDIQLEEKTMISLETSKTQNRYTVFESFFH